MRLQPGDRVRLGRRSVHIVAGIRYIYGHQVSLLCYTKWRPAWTLARAADEVPVCKNCARIAERQAGPGPQHPETEKPQIGR